MIRMDFETQSKFDIDYGAWGYSRCPTTRIICLSHKVRHEPTRLWVPQRDKAAWEKALPIYIEKRKAEKLRLERAEARLVLSNNTTYNRILKKMDKLLQNPIEGVVITCAQDVLNLELAELEKEKQALDQWPDITEPFWHYDPPAWAVSEEEFKKAGGIAEAHNTGFEQAIWRNICVPLYGFIPLKNSQWQDSMSKCAAHSLPLALGEAPKAMKLPVLKDEQGKLSMLQISQPRKPTQTNPSEWHTIEESPEKFIITYKYCINDTDVQYGISTSLPDLIPQERLVWAHTEAINLRGIGIDRDLAEVASKLCVKFKHWGEKRLLELTNNEVQTFQQNAKFIEFCRKRGHTLDNLQKGYLQSELPKIKDKVVEELVGLRLALAKSSTAKLDVMIKSPDRLDNRIRYCTVYHGAGTGREAARLLQQQNFPKGKIKNVDEAINDIRTLSFEAMQDKWGANSIMDVVSSCLRGMIIPAEGNDFIAADYNAIEARVVLYLAGETLALDAFKTGQDLYKIMASFIYKKPIEDITPDERQLGKAAVLGCGFQMGPDKFHLTCLANGINLTYEMACEAVSTYRSTYAEVVKFWTNSIGAMEEALVTRKPVKFNMCTAVYDEKYDFLRIILPSGRSLAYAYPRIIKAPNRFNPNKMEQKFSFMAVNPKTRKWERTTTHGGLIVENIVQATARDCMVEGCLRAEKAGYKIVFKVHDEVVCEVPKDFGSVEEFENLLAVPPQWAPDMPIKAEGWRGPRYKK